MRSNYREMPNKNVKLCDIEGCTEHGEHRAPKDRNAVNNNPDDYMWLCLNHVREYNKSWNYFNGMSREEIEEFQSSAPTGHRPTWSYHLPPHMTEAMIRARLSSVFDGINGDVYGEREGGAGAGAGQKKAHDEGFSGTAISRKDMEALTIMGLEYPTTMDEIKKQYKKLVKRYHPDKNNGDKSLEERFKQITQAYRHLSVTYKECL